MKNIKQFYKELGKLVYALAIADGVIQDEEKTELTSFVVKELAHHETEYDTSGMNKAFYVDFEFEKSLEEHLDYNKAIASYKSFVGRNFEEGDEVLLNRAIILLTKVKEAYTKQKENNILAIVQQQLNDLKYITQ